MLNLVFVGLGGFLGSIGRYLSAGAVYQIFPNAFFPLAQPWLTFWDFFLIGFITGMAEVRNLLSPELRVFLLIGLLGGFTTFSTFGYETIALLRDGAFLTAVVNVLVQVIMGLSAVWIGFNVIRYF